MSNLTKSNKSIKQTKTNQSLVHIKHSITIRQYKYWHLLIKFFADQLEEGVLPDENGFQYVTRKKFEEYIGYEVVTKELKLDIEALRKEPITINYLEKDGKPAIHGMGFVSEYKITSSRIGFKFPSFLVNAIKDEDESKKLFMLLNWSIFNSFTGKYEAIIYKLCKDYIGIGRTPSFTVEEYREYIGLNKEEYPQFYKLNEWTLKKPILNINANDLCDISVQVQLEKSGRTVKSLHFTMQHKKQNILPFDEFQPNPVFSPARISISFENQSKYLEAYTEEEIQATIERANEYIDQLKSSGKAVNMGAIYNKAFTENWGESRLQEKQLDQAVNQEKQLQLERKKQIKQAEEEIQLSKEQAAKKMIEQFSMLPEEVKTGIVETMIKKHKPLKIVHDALKKTFLEHGFDAHFYSPVFRGNLISEIEAYLDTST